MTRNDLAQLVHDASHEYGEGPRMRRIRARVLASAQARLDELGFPISEWHETRTLPTATVEVLRDHIAEALFDASFDL